MQFFDTWIEKGIVARLNVCNSDCQLFMYILSRYYASPILTFLQRKIWPMESWLSGWGGNLDDQIDGNSVGKEEILFEKNELHYLITDGWILYGGKNSNN